MSRVLSRHSSPSHCCVADTNWASRWSGCWSRKRPSTPSPTSMAACESNSWAPPAASRGSYWSSSFRWWSSVPCCSPGSSMRDGVRHLTSKQCMTAACTGPPSPKPCRQQVERARSRHVRIEAIFLRRITMKLAQARIVTNDVLALTRFYADVTGMTPKGDDRYVEFHAPALTLAISSQRTMDAHGAGATAPRANRSLILDFEVADVDKERER